MPPSSFLPGTAIEIRNPALRRGRIRFALFDFDGTLSLIREGWQQVMVPMMVEILRDTPHAEDAGQIELAVREFVATLTGKQTIYQMIQLCEEIEKRGGLPREPLWYKKLYLQRLWERIRSRIDALERGAADPDEMMVPGARALLEALRERGVRLFLASGTDLSDVKREAQLLRLSGYFEGGIYGALDDYKNFSKAMVVDRIVREHGLKGEEFVAFGDGYVEIENVKAVEGIAVGAATDEARRQGVDEWKRQRLIRAGADLIVPDFREWRALVAYLFDE
ncbi:MAG: HAD family hydrolase [Candidatus Sumerlaeota bacterium]|nr:HAD family hydrolase [Candidatus Sumerlaeota bacterium]